MPVDAGFVAENHDVAKWQTLDFHVAAAGADQYTPGHQHVAGLRFLDTQRADFIQAAGKHVGEAVGHVLNDGDRAGEIAWELGQNVFEGLRASGGYADRDDPVWRSRGSRGFLGFGLRASQHARFQLALRRGFDLSDQFARGFSHVRGSVFWFRDEVECTEPQRLHGDGCAFSAVGAEDDHGHGLPPHDLFQRVNAVHTRHFQVERDHVGLELFDLLEAERAVHRRADHVDGFVGREHLRDQLAHQRRVVDYED